MEKLLTELMEQMNKGFSNIDKRFDRLGAKVDNLEVQFDHLKQKIEDNATEFRSHLLKRD